MGYCDRDANALRNAGHSSRASRSWTSVSRSERNKPLSPRVSFWSTSCGGTQTGRNAPRFPAAQIAARGARGILPRSDGPPGMSGEIVSITSSTGTSATERSAPASNGTPAAGSGVETNRAAIASTIASAACNSSAGISNISISGRATR